MEKTIDHNAVGNQKANQNTQIQSDLDGTIANTVADKGQATKTVDANVCIAGYDIQLKLGEGGMGAVYLANDSKLDRLVAVKVISNTAMRSTSAIERFAKEIKAVAALRHPNIAQLYSASEENNVPYFVMEFVDGCPLDERLKKQPLQPSIAAELLRKLALAIQHCHDHGIVHRDLKPSNILMDTNDEPKIADFGLAKYFDEQVSTTQTGDLVGTPAYMSPEQAMGKSSLIGPACDIYGLGAVLYHALTGRMPFAAPTIMETVNKVASDDPIPPTRLQNSVPKDLETICLKCLAKDPAKRYSSAGELEKDLQRFLNSEPILARPVSALERTAKWIRRHPAWAVLIAVFCIGIPAAFAWQAYNSATLKSALQREQKALKQADDELDKTKRLSDGASELTTWLLGQHQTDIGHLNGSIKVVNALQSKVKSYLDDAIQDMPEESKFVRRLAESYVQLATSVGGEYVSNLGDHVEAKSLMDRAMSLFDKALEIDPADQVTRNLKIRGLLTLSEMQQSLGNAEQARDSFATAEQMFESDNSDLSSDRRFLRLLVLQAKFHRLKSAQKPKDAIALLETFESVIHGGNEKPLDPEEAEHQLIWKLNAEASILKTVGDYEEALVVADRGLEIAKKAYDRDPKNSTSISRLANLLGSQAEMQMMNRQFEKAVETLVRAADLRQKHFEANPHDLMAKFNLANSWGSLAGAFMQIRKPEKELQYATKAFELFDELAKNSPSSLSYRRTLAEAFRNVAAAQVSNSLFDEAIDSYEQAFQIIESIIETHPTISNLGFKAELALQSGLVQFQQLTMDESIFSGASVDIRERQEFKNALSQFEVSENVFKNAANEGQLTYQQEYIQNQVGQARKVMFELADKLMGNNEE